jgi:aminopeptidase N
MFNTDRTLLDKWFAIQAQFCPANQAVKTINSLCKHKDFHVLNPNRFNSVITTFAKANFAGFNQKNGLGYQTTIKWIEKVDKFNPQMAARLTKSFEHIKFLPDQYSKKITDQLTELYQKKDISKDTREIIHRLINYS